MCLIWDGRAEQGFFLEQDKSCQLNACKIVHNDKEIIEKIVSAELSNIIT